MKKNSIEKKLNKILNEEETFVLSIILLAHLNEEEKYKDISELIFLFDNYKGFKQFIKFYEGKNISVPSVKEVKQTLKLLSLFQMVKIDKKDFDQSYDILKLDLLNLSKSYCNAEIDKFLKLLNKDGNTIIKQLKKLK